MLRPPNLCDDSNGSDKPKIRVVEHLYDPWFIQIDGDGGVVSSSSLPAQSTVLRNRGIEELAKRDEADVQANKDDIDATIRFPVAHLQCDRELRPLNWHYHKPSSSSRTLIG